MMASAIEAWPVVAAALQIAALAIAGAGIARATATARAASPSPAGDREARARQEGLALIVRQLPAHLWTADRDLRLVSVGGRGLETVGMRAADLEGRAVATIGEREGSGPFNVELHLRAMAGETVPFRTTLAGQCIEGAAGPIRDDAGVIAGVAGVGINVTERETAAELARSSSRTMQEILDRAPASIFIRDLEGRLIFVNRNWENVLGILRQKAIGTTFSDLYPPDDARVYEQHFRAALATPEPMSMIDRGVVDGIERSYLSVRFPLRRADGTVYAVCGVSTDRTEHIRMQEELRRRQSLLDDAQAMAGLASWEMNLVSGERYFSPHLDSLLGRESAAGNGEKASARGAVGGDAHAHVAELLFSRAVEEDRSRAGGEVVSALAEGREYRVQYRVRRRGEIAWLEAVGNVERDGDGTAVRYFGFVQDITDRVRTRSEISVLNERLEERVRQRSQRLEVAVKELSSFSYAVSHDLRQPLRAIAGYMSLLQEEAGSKLTEEACQYITRVQTAARRMDAIIDDLLSLSRVSHASFERVTLDLSAMARDVAAEVAAADPARNVEWNIEEGLEVRADKGLVRIILQNLFGNAFKFSRSRERAVIELGSEMEDGERVYFVRDNGAGFEPSYAQRLFEPFQRLHDASRFEGTGIGLATVARIVRRHGGWIRATAAPEEGATFRFTLPPGQPPR